MLHPFRLVCLTALSLGIGAPVAEAAKSVQLSVTTTGGPRGVQLNISPIGDGTALNVAVAGTAAGEITVSDPGGLQLLAGSGAPCAEVDANTARCGAIDDPVTYATVTGGAKDDVVDLSGLATQARSLKAFDLGPAAFDVDRRMRGIFVNVLTAGGADVITGGGAGASYVPGDGNDTVHGGPGDEVLRAGDEPTDGADVFDGGAGYDTMSYSPRTTPVSGTLSDGVASGLGGLLPASENDSVQQVEALVGGKGDDTLSITGQLGDRGTLAGGAGNDTVTGGPGPDKLSGGSGKDEVFGGDGDDQLVDPGVDSAYAGSQAVNLPGHLNGGAGDDELFQQSSAEQFRPFVDGAPTCGPGTDVLRADPGADEGVGLYAGPADCELLATVGGFDSAISGELRVSKTVTVTPAADMLGTPINGRMGETRWEICTNGVPTCEQRKTDGPQITFGPGDQGKYLLFAHVRQVEPLSQNPRWLEERAGTPQLAPRMLMARPSSTGLILDVEAPTPPPVKPPVMPVPDAAAALKAFKTALGSKPKLKLLAKGSSVKFAATAGAKLSVKLSLTKRKKTTTLSAGMAVVDAKGVTQLTLAPTKAGKKAAKAGKKLKLTIDVTATSAAGTATATSTVTLRTSQREGGRARNNVASR